ncbi:Panacea domain-containing protein [Asticcacaulis excentricus]|uniref:Uncharacterized phage-associated protein-like protein n=1 Tax=Asticcacaulis excentricus (strain ATCC 15261 / DSM 4724 / KCTC 12464 / NCIMB 9791 / VKM B-1370 / CB 48) TaxID=573065 RepID=E8RPL8_ASTEC|nr:Panacea domain-containing protein [Asticcacaulis excentricus]ADU11995.1 uncharacterized phage-associated protein-like protein [Asticcacaulis excentricus CB 48]
MPGHSATAIANEFVRLNGGPLDQMKLQKLVYMAHGWNLALNQEPLVKDRIEAWDGGPVFRAIWDHIKFFGISGSGFLVDPFARNPITTNALTPNERAVIDHVWKKYKPYTGHMLSEMTHQRGTPWYNSYLSGRNTAISDEAIRDHYLELARLGREQATH